MDSGSDQLNGPGIGALLRASRLRCGEDLQDIAQLLRIRYTYLDAIEDGRFKDLPGLTYALGFVRAYAEHLGLDSAEVVRRFKVEAADVQRKAELQFPTPIPEGGIPGGAILFVGVFIAAIAYGGWYISTSEDGFLQNLVEPIPERLAELMGSDDPAQQGAEPGEPSSVIVSGNEEPASRSPSDATAATVDQVPSTAVMPQSAATTSPAAPNDETVAPLASQTEATTDVPAAPTVALAATDEGSPTPQPTTPAEPAQAPGTQASAAEAVTPNAPTTPPAAPTPQQPVAEAQAPQQPIVIAAVPRKPETPIQAPAPALAEQSNSTVPALPPAAPALTPLQAAATVPTAPSLQEPQNTAPEIPETEAVGLENESSRILLRATADSWVQIRDGVADKLVVTRLLKSGDSYHVPDKPGLVLVTGNAGALEIIVDGQAIDPIGPMGAVRRNVALNADKLRDGTAVPN